MCGATREHRPTTFWPYHPHGVSAYSVFFMCCTVWLNWLQKGWSQRLKLPDSVQYSSRNKDSIRVLTTSMMTTLRLSVKAVGQPGYKEMY